MEPSDIPEHVRRRLRTPWSRSSRLVPRTVIRPIQEFMHREASSAIVLGLAALAALVWANLDYGSYDHVWHLHLQVGLGEWTFDESLRHVVNDGLMALFFFVIGLEVKRELTVGELRERRAAMLPLFAALGGMVVPAATYLAITAGRAGAEGWGIPMATDIAFALGVLALLGDRVPDALKAFILGIAVVDDIGAILVIALFYSDGIAYGWLMAAIGGLAAIAACRRLQIRALPVYVTLGLGTWLATYESGVHATIAGVAIGLLTPARPFQESDAVSDVARHTADVTTDDHDDPDEDAYEWRRLAWLSRQAISPLAFMQHVLHPWTSYLILPLFALANVGVVLDAQTALDALTNPIGAGIAAGLVLGKPVGIVLASLLAVRIGVARLPDRVTWWHVAGIGSLAGIGFTVSLFISTLAFPSEARVTVATFAVLASSLAAGVIGSAALLLAHRRSHRTGR